MASEPLVIDLKVLSPSTEVAGDINLPQIPASTTVKELRLKLQDAIPSRPVTDRMRLIYRGKVVANEMDTLSDVFGADNIRGCKEQIIHLVLRELPPSSTSSSPAPRSSTAPPNPFRPAQTPAPPQTNPFRPLPQQARPNSQPQIPHPHHHHHHHHLPPPPANPFGFPPIHAAAAQQFQQQIAQAMAQQNNAQNGVPPAQPARAGTPASADGQQPATADGRPASGVNPPPVPNSVQTVRHERIGPNGERWTMTINNTSVTIPNVPGQQPMLPRTGPFPMNAPPFGLPPRRSPAPIDGMDQVLNRIRVGLQTARREMENVRVLLQRPDGSAGELATANPPVWRLDQIRSHVHNLTHNLNQVQHGLAAIVRDPAMAHRQDVLVLQQSANELRSSAESLNGMLDRLRNGTSSASSQGQEPGSTGTTEGNWPPPALSPLPQGAQQIIQGLPDPPTIPRSELQQLAQASGAATAPTPTATSPELFILSSPQGPVGILFDQRGTYATAPMAPTLPFASFTNQFAANRQVLAGISQQIAQNTAQLQNRLAMGQQLPAGQPVNPTLINPAQVPAQNQNQNQNQNQGNQPQANANANGQAQQPQAQAGVGHPAAPAVPPEDPMANIGNHIWRFLQIATFFLFFAGNSSWQRIFMIGGICLIVTVVQMRMFDEYRRMVRQHFERLLPVHQNAPAAGAGGQAGGAAQGGQAGAGQNPTPEEAARRLVQAHQERGPFRRMVRTAERGVALFVASLWPGIGERMVAQQEERERAERRARDEAEVARQRAEEEERQRAEAEQEKSKESAGEESTGGEESIGGEDKGKGKEKVSEDVQQEAGAAASAS